MYIDLTEYKNFSKSDFTGDNLTLHIPRVLKSLRTVNGRIEITLDALICRKEAIVISMLMKGREFRFTGEWTEMTMSLEFVTPSVVRVKMANGSSIPVKHQPMLLKEPIAKECYKCTESEDAYRIQTNKMVVILYKNPFRMEIEDNKGRLIYRQYNDDLHNVSNDRRRGFKEGDDDNTSNDISNLSFPGFECFPFGYVEDTNTGSSCYCESVETRFDECFYGFGERFSRINKNGQEILNWITNPVGVSNTKAYKAVPFFHSSRGYGVYYNTPRKIRFSMGEYFYKAYSCEVEDDLLDYFIFVTGDYRETLDKYTELTGKSLVPPKWSFGVWMSRNCYMSQSEVEEVAEKLRQENLPCDVMHIDWAYCKTYDYDFEFDKKRFPDVKGMSEKLLNMGIKLSLWHVPYIKETSPIYKEIAEKGLLARHEDGTIADSEAREGVLDFSNPETVEWYKEKLRDLLRQGIRVIKTDFGENAQDCYVYHSVDGRDMHNLYPLFYNKAAYEACQEIHPGDSLVWGRSAYAGNQKYPIYWGGDSDSDYNGMYHSLRGGLSLGLSGFPFWSHDVGGYFCTPEPDVYIRWLQFGMLSPLVRFHGTSSREPWAYGDEAVRQYKKYAALRYSLMEYLYSEAIRCAEDGTPMLRALMLEFPDDPMTENIDDEYLLGRNILVAPVFSSDPVRKVYLPAGTSWLDLHNYKWYSGGKTVEIETPIDITPVFLRGETATPFVEPMNHVDEHPHKKIRWEICPVHDISYYDLKTDKFDICFRYDFDGSTGVGKIEISGAEGLELTYHINCPDVKKLYINGQQTDFTYEDNNFVIVKEKR